MKERSKELSSDSPLVLTLRLDAASQAWFDVLRYRYFPPERLVVGAHVTMFHALPGHEIAAVQGAISEAAARTAAFGVRCTGLRFLGRGVAFTLAAPEAARLRDDLARQFAPFLTPQDRQKWQPHVTVQNKVAPETARQTLTELAALEPPAIEARGLALWHYRNGPWEFASETEFQ